LADLDCRNNRLLAPALDQIAAPIAELRDDFGAGSRRRRAWHQHIRNIGR